jgi:hypothetical protein
MGNKMDAPKGKSSQRQQYQPRLKPYTHGASDCVTEAEWTSDSRLIEAVIVVKENRGTQAHENSRRTKDSRATIDGGLHFLWIS